MNIDNLIIIYETLTNGFKSEVLDIIYLVAIFFGIYVIINKNPIISILFLIGLFSSISFYLILLGIDYIGFAYLIVYVGAVSILFLFILMLINIRISELQSNTVNSIPLAISIGILFNSSLFQLLSYDVVRSSKLNMMIYNIQDLLSLNQIMDLFKSSWNIWETNNNLFYIVTKVWDGNITEINHITSIGNIMYTNYNIWLIIVSFTLLLAMVGAIVITIKSKI